jgi:hypothetical protein
MKAVLTACLVLATIASAFGQVPSLLSYQGRVTDASGNPIGAANPANRLVTFKFYTASTGGSPLYAESQVVTIASGDFSVLIGNGSGIAGFPGPTSPASPIVPLATIITGPLYLGITVDDGTEAVDPEISPRQQIVSAAYAIRAKQAERLVDLALAESMIADLAVSTNKLQASSVTTAKLADLSVTTGKLIDRSVTAAKLDSTIGVWTTNGTNVYRTSGNVGIGTSSPGFPLNFASTLGNKIALYGSSGDHFGLGIQSSLMQLYTGTSSQDIALGFGSSAAFTENVRFKGNGNVGIGLTAPSQRLHVQGNVLSSPGDWASGGTAYVYLGDTQNFVSSTQGSGTVLRGLNFVALQASSGTEALRAVSNGNVGIGTSNPQLKLEVGLFASGVSQNNGLRLGTRNTVGSSSYRYADLRLKSDEAGVYRATIDVNNNGSAAPTEAFSLRLSGGDATFVRNVTAGGQVTSATAAVGSNAPTSTGAPLRVGSISATYSSFGRLTTNGANEGNTTVTGPLSIHTDGAVFCPRVDITSDGRLKDVFGLSFGAEDLLTLSRIEITDFAFRDKVGRGSTAEKKVIAQQVESVFPQAVVSRSGVVPDIYANAFAREGWVMLATDLKQGDRVRLIYPGGEGLHEVLETRGGAFLVGLDANVTEVFVFGREVPDVRSVDYDAIAMLNVSATQELHRRVIALESAAAEKDAEISRLDERLRLIEQRLGL